MKALKAQLSAGTNFPTGIIELKVVEVSKGARAKIAAKYAIIGGLISLLLALIPILHFILVPIGLLLTALIAFRQLRPYSVISESHGQCPACNKPYRLATQAYKSSFTDVCEFCGRRIIVST